MRRYCTWCILVVLTIVGVFPIKHTFASTNFITEGNYTYSEDSDLVKTRTWRLGTLNEKDPLKLTLYKTRIDQPSKSLNETTAVAKYRTTINGEDTVTIWLGVSHNDISNFYPYAVMYDGQINNRGHYWLSHGRESLGTITAYEQNIHSKSTGLTLVNNLSPSIEGNLDLKRTSYSDGNNRDILVLTLTKQLSKEWKIKAGYLSDSADHKATGIYYVPVQERAYFIGGEFSIPLGTASLKVNGDKSFFAKNSDGTIKRYGGGVNINAGNFNAGIRYDKSGDYWSRTGSIMWRQQW